MRRICINLLIFFLLQTSCTFYKNTASNDENDKDPSKEDVKIEQKISSVRERMKTDHNDPALYRKLAVLYRLQGTPRSRSKSIESIEKAILKLFPGRIGELNVTAVKMSYDKASDVVQATNKIPAEAEDITVGGYGVLRDVSSWRVFQPNIDLDKCIECKNCWIYCPETAINWTDENKPEIEWRKCKGCGICVNECPVEAIKFERVEIEE